MPVGDPHARPPERVVSGDVGHRRLARVAGVRRDDAVPRGRVRAREQAGEPPQRGGQQVPARLREQRALAVVRADQQWDGVRRAGRESVEWVHREELAVNDRGEAEHTGGRLVRPLVEQGPGGDERVGRRPEQGVDGVLLVHAEQADQLSGPARGPIGGVGGGRCRALRDHPVEQPARGGYGQQGRHRDSTGRLAEDRDVAGVAPEGRDVVAHPLQRRDLVADAQVGVERPLRRRVAGDVGESQRAETIVERDVDQVAGPGERVPGVPRHRRRAHAERSAVDPHHHGARRAGCGGCHDVDRQAVLVHRGAPARADQVDERALLRWHRAERRRVAHPDPRFRRPGRPEPPLPRRRRRVRDPAPCAQVVAHRDAAHHAGGGPNLQIARHADDPRRSGSASRCRANAFHRVFGEPR